MHRSFNCNERRDLLHQLDSRNSRFWHQASSCIETQGHLPSFRRQRVGARLVGQAAGDRPQNFSCRDQSGKPLSMSQILSGGSTRPGPQRFLMFQEMKSTETCFPNREANNALLCIVQDKRKRQTDKDTHWIVDCMHMANK